MSIPKKITNFLDKNKVKYEIIKHKTVYTAFDKAATLKKPTKIIGKTLLVKIDQNHYLILIAANRNLDFKKLKKITKAKNISFLKEAWMKKNLKGVKVGAIAPFGNLWKIKTLVDKELFNNKEIIINAGDYNFSIKINPNVIKKIIPALIIEKVSIAKK